MADPPPIPPLLEVRALRRRRRSTRVASPLVRAAAGLAAVTAGLWLLPSSGGGQEAESPGLPYTVTLEPTGDSALDAAAQAVSALVRLRERAPTDAFGLAARARNDVPRFVEALRSEGYYGGSVRITLGGEPLDAPDLDARLERLPGPVAVRVEIARGERYRIERIAIAAEPPAAESRLAEATRSLGVAVGDPARAAPVLDAAEGVIGRLRQAGQPLAALAEQDVVVDHDRRTMEVAWRFAPGPVARFAPPRLGDTGRTDAGLAQRVAARRLGDGVYSPAAVERARRALLGLGPFGTVRVEEARALDAEGRLPVTFTVTERPRRVVGFGLGYETNYGPTARAYWEHRNLFGGAERLRIEGEVSRIGQSASDRATYSAFATYRLPELFRRDIQLAIRAGALRERLDAYDRDAILASAILERPLTERLVLQGGPGYEAGRVGRDGNLLDFQYVSLLMGLRYDGTDSLLNPVRGYRVALTATPFVSAGQGASFTRLLATASAYWSLAPEGATVLALRGSIGAAVGASRDEIPLDKRFYAGGGGSVRGYAYQGVGPRDATNRPIGGTSLVEASLELRQRITGNWGAVAFVDAGSVGGSATPSLSDARVGVGVGLRYLTAIGPLRLDVALPLNRQSGDAGYGLYVGIGQAF